MCTIRNGDFSSFLWYKEENIRNYSPVTIVGMRIKGIFGVLNYKYSTMSRILNLPVEAIKQLEPILSGCIGYSWELFVHEYAHIIDIYSRQDDQKEPDPDYEEYIAIPPLSRDRIPLSVWNKEAYDFSLEIGKCFPLPWIDKDFTKLISLCTEHEADKDSNILGLGLLILTSIYQKYKQMPDFGWSEFLTETANLDYTYSTRPDLLKLYRFMNEAAKASSKITIVSEDGGKVELTNRDGWFKIMTATYLNKRLCISDMKEALEELEKDYPVNKKKGRKKIKPEFDMLLMGCYNLATKYSTLNPPDVLISNGMIEFILSYLDYTGILEEMPEDVDDIPYIRAKIKYLLQTDFKPVWYKSPELKIDPDDIEFADRVKESENYIGEVSWQRHPVLDQREFQKLFNKKK